LHDDLPGVLALTAKKHRSIVPLERGEREKKKREREGERQHDYATQPCLQRSSAFPPGT
jgi:hypothetical protein